MPNSPDRARRVTIDGSGPLLVEGPVEVVGDDGSVSVSTRFVVAICVCRRSRTYPWCDTSHRRRVPRGSQKAPDIAPRGRNEETTNEEKGTG
ncbi:CDGSH iron-sulfur domain-containing protein [Streptomyces sp. NBC_00344]|uniref:CDGSH iron-sulfur domain-containing protein n=1 Tax=Streptomyces sp. NBC_00344 TaxID=2975720 RepID=UPI002E24C5FB